MQCPYIFFISKKKQKRRKAPLVAAKHVKMANNCLIIGDSYSTYEGCVPKGFAVYYTPEGKGPEHPTTKMQLNETWWSRMLAKTDFRLIENNSWSGSTICYTAYEGRDCSMNSSFIYRYRQLYKNGFFSQNRIDTVFVFGGTNDSWSNAPLGEMKLENFTEKDLYRVLPAICYFMKTLKEDLPTTRVIFIANCDIKEEITACMRSAGEHFGVEVISLLGVTKVAGHPTPVGMAEICEQVMAKL